MQVYSGRSNNLPQKNSRLLSLYNDIPQEELTLDEFELFALDRLQLLRGIALLKTKNFEGKEYEQRFQQLEKKYMPIVRKPTDVIGKDGWTESQRKDIVSHFILRIAYCKTDELRRWFLENECKLLENRLLNLSDKDRSQVMAENNLAYETVDDTSRYNRLDKLVGLAGVKDSQEVLRSIYYKVPFTQALQLISSRQVYIEDGHAFVPIQKLISIILSKFRMNLSKSLTDASSMFEHVTADPRIGSLLKNVDKQYVGKDYSKVQPVDKLTPESVDHAAEINMPICMKNLHNALKREHKLKHWGRLQYGLFLKGAGLSLDDAQLFWENQFAKLISHDDFNKKYLYTFRHMYGKEGARKNYTPYTCMKIIMGTPPEMGGFHGCPYKHLKDDQLMSLLQSLKLPSSSDADEIFKIGKKDGHFQIACQKHFEVTHPGYLKMENMNINESVANHPNQWYAASVNYHKIKNGITATAAIENASSVDMFVAHADSSATSTVDNQASTSMH